MFGLTPFDAHSDFFDPFRDFDRKFFEAPAVFRTDIRDEGDKFVMETEMPGFDKSDINLDISGNTLTLSAEHKTESEQKDSKGNYIRRERRYGSYSRAFDITGIDADKIEAEYKNGVLELLLPKRSASKPEARRLTVK